MAFLLIPGPASGAGATDYVKVYGERRVGQRFRYPLSNLDRVGLQIRTPDRPNPADILVRIRKSPAAERDIAVIRTPVAGIASERVHWFRFRPIGDDEDPAYYVEIASPGSTEENAPAVRFEAAPVAGTLGSFRIDGLEQAGHLAIRLQTARSLWTRAGYVLARFTIDKPRFYNRYFYAVIFLVYGLMVAGFLIYTYKLLHRPDADKSHARAVPSSFVVYVTALFLVRGILYGSLFPAWEAPDEPAHFSTILYMAEHGALPGRNAVIDPRVLASMDRADHALILRGGRPKPDGQTWVQDPREESIRDRRAFLTTAGLPFLYHLAVSVPYRLIEGFDTTTQLFLLRMMMACLSCSMIVMAWRVAKLLAPADRTLQILIPAVLCFFSMFTYMASVVSYDVLTNILSAGFIWILVRALIRGLTWRGALAGGFCLGCALLTKAAALILLPGTPAWLALAWRSDRPGIHRRTATRWAGMMAVAGGVGGWWYARNLLTTGHLVLNQTPYWSRGEMNMDLGLLTPAQVGWDAFQTHVPFLAAVWETLSRTFSGAVGGFGWGTTPLTPAMYAIAAVVAVCACMGAAIAIRSMMRQLSRQNAAKVWLAAVAVIYAALLTFELGRATQGRYLFPVLVPAVCWFSIGLLRLAPAKHRRTAGWFLLAGMVLFDTSVLLETIIPRYYLIPPPSKILQYFF